MPARTAASAAAAAIDGGKSDVRESQPASQSEDGHGVTTSQMARELMRIPPFHSPVLELVRPFMAILPEIAPPERKVRLSVNVKSTQ